MTSELKRAIGIDIGGTNVVGAVVDEKGIIHKREHMPAEAHKGGNALLDKLVQIVEVLKDDAIAGVGIGTPGPVDSHLGVVKQVVNIPGWEGVPVAALMEERTGFKTYLGNDANVAALAEYWQGAGRQKRVVIILTLGTGIGGGVVIDGHIFDGSEGWAAELGHMSISYDGRVCACGKTGCIETYASANAVIKRYIEKLGDRRDTPVMAKAGGNLRAIDARMIFDAAREGESLAREIADETGFYLGIFCGTLINGFNPDVILLGGGMAGAGDILFDRVREVARGQCLTDPGKHALIVPAALGNDAGILGAAAMVFLAHDCGGWANPIGD